jgi:hypothetical protein
MSELGQSTKAVFLALKSDFRVSPYSGLKSDIAPCPFGAKERHRLDHDPSAQVAGIVN